MPHSYRSREPDSIDLTIRISYDDFLTRFDLDEIISSIDRLVEDDQSPGIHGDPYLSSGRPSVGPELSYVGIRSIEPGSITLLVIVGSAVATYVAKRFFKGVTKSALGKELERGGRIFGDALGPLAGRINDWAEKWVPQQRAMGGNVTKISAHPEDTNEPTSAASASA